MSHVSQPQSSLDAKIRRALPPRRYRELEAVEILEDFPDKGLKRGETGTIIHAFDVAHAYLIEFVNEDGSTKAEITVEPRQIRPA